MTLFDNQQSANLESTIAMVEDVLIELGHFVNDCRVEREGSLRAWITTTGSALTEIALERREETSWLCVSSIVLTLAGEIDRAGLFEHLLELNASTVTGAAFALSGAHVMLLAERSTVDLDRSEVLDLIGRVQRYADEHDDALVERFGGVLGRG